MRNWPVIPTPTRSVNPSVAINAEDSEFIIIKFKLGTYMPCFPVKNYIDGEFALPEATSQSVWLNGSAWQLFDYDNVESFLDRLVRDCGYSAAHLAEHHHPHG